MSLKPTTLCTSGTGFFDRCGLWRPWDTGVDAHDGNTFKEHVDAAAAMLKHDMATFFGLEPERSLGSILGHHTVRNFFRNGEREDSLRRSSYLAKAADAHRHLWAGPWNPGVIAIQIARETQTFLAKTSIGKARTLQACLAPKPHCLDSKCIFKFENIFFEFATSCFQFETYCLTLTRTFDFNSFFGNSTYVVYFKP